MPVPADVQLRGLETSKSPYIYFVQEIEAKKKVIVVYSSNSLMRV